MKKILILFWFCQIAAAPLISQTILTASQEKGAIKLIAAYEAQIEIIDSLISRNKQCLQVTNDFLLEIDQIKKTFDSCEKISEDLKTRVVKLERDIIREKKRTKRRQFIFGVGGTLIGAGAVFLVTK